MKAENENVEIYEGEEIVTLYDADEKPVDFYELASVEYNGDIYAVLEPVDGFEDAEEGEVVIFKVEEGDDENDNFVDVEDDETLDAVFNLFVEALPEGECDCDCEDCEGEGHEDCECDCEDCANKKED